MIYVEFAQAGFFECQIIIESYVIKGEKREGVKIRRGCVRWGQLVLKISEMIFFFKFFFTAIYV